MGWGWWSRSVRHPCAVHGCNVRARRVLVAAQRSAECRMRSIVRVRDERDGVCLAEGSKSPLHDSLSMFLVWCVLCIDLVLPRQI